MPSDPTSHLSDSEGFSDLEETSLADLNSDMSSVVPNSPLAPSSATIQTTRSNDTVTAELGLDAPQRSSRFYLSDDMVTFSVRTF